MTPANFRYKNQCATFSCVPDTSNKQPQKEAKKTIPSITAWRQGEGGKETFRKKRGEEDEISVC